MSLNHFLEISQLNHLQVNSLMQRALYFKNTLQYPNYSTHYLANLFYENSTRTRISFELAAQRLAIPVVNLELARSSESKGEMLEDTIKNLAAMGIDLFVIRHVQDRLQQKLANKLNLPIHIINAGDGTHAHPSQALLDLMTIKEKKPDLSALKITIVGNIRHSRVANSLQCLCALMGVGQLMLVAPAIWQPQIVHYGQVTDSLATGLKEADVVICLRVQKERLHNNENLNLADYCDDFTLTPKRLQLAKPDAIIMHPGPLNRGIEIESEVADGVQSVILDQVRNGVFMRMAILESLIKHAKFN